jgi:hypothetical protein
VSGYSVEFKKRGGYSIDEETLSYLWRATAKFMVGKAPEFQIDLQGNHRINAKDMQTVLADPFVKSNLIRAIDIKGSEIREEGSDHVFDHIVISLNGPSELFVSTISVSLAGERGRCIIARGEIETALEKGRVWYSRFFFVHDIFWLVMGVAACGTASQVLVKQVFEHYGLNYDWLAAVFLQIVPTGLIFMLVRWLIRVMFPSLIFDLGISSSVGVRAAYWRNVFGVVVVIGLIVGVLASVAYEYLFK